MLEKLKPCPVCGHAPEHPRDFFDCDGENVFYVGCDNKECPADIGIIHEDVEEAAHIWNALPRPLRWTKEPPTEPGWYFFRGNIPGYHENNSPVYVDVHQNKVVLVRRASWVLSNLIIKYDIEWAGPIQEPVE